jgi:hypothetical protein
LLLLQWSFWGNNEARRKEDHVREAAIPESLQEARGRPSHKQTTMHMS